MCLAIPGRIVGIDDDDPLVRRGWVDFGGVIKDVALACVPEAGVGDYVLVHAGMAISKVDEREAGKVFEFLNDLSEGDELEVPAE